MQPSRRRTNAHRPPASGTMPAFGRPRTAVVVDEHAGVLGVLVEMLEHEGWTVSGFQRVDDAVAFVRATLPDVVLTDLDVGETTGAALAHELRLDPATANVTLVAMGGARPPPATARLFDELLLKPIELTRLTDVLRLAIARHRE